MSGTRAKATALLAVLQLTAAPALLSPGAELLAQSRGVDTLVPAQPVGLVNDFASVLDPESSGRMQDLIQRLRSATGAEIAVVTLPSIGNHDAAEVALAIGRKWKVGAKAEIGNPRRNAGIVLLVVPRQNHQPGTGHIRIEVGQGLEGIIPDALTPRIRQDIMGPDLNREAYGPALLKGVEFLASTIARAYGVSDTALTAYKPVPEGGGSPPVSSLLPILFFIVFMVLATRAQSGRRRRRHVYWGGPWIGGGWGGGGGFGGGRGGFGGFGGGGGFSGGGGGGRF